MYFPDEDAANADDHVLSAVVDGASSSLARPKAVSSSTFDSRARTRPSSSPDVFDRIFVPEQFRDALSDAAWLQAMLDVERLSPLRSHARRDS